MLVIHVFSRHTENGKLIAIVRYTDTPDGDWIIDKYESDPSLIIATAGSGHAYKVCYELFLCGAALNHRDIYP